MDKDISNGRLDTNLENPSYSETILGILGEIKNCLIHLQMTRPIPLPNEEDDAYIDSLSDQQQKEKQLNNSNFIFKLYQRTSFQVERNQDSSENIHLNREMNNMNKNKQNTVDSWKKEQLPIKNNFVTIHQSNESIYTRSTH